MSVSPVLGEMPALSAGNKKISRVLGRFFYSNPYYGVGVAVTSTADPT